MQAKQYVCSLNLANLELTIHRFYNAHETTAVEEFAIALLCGDIRCDARTALSLILQAWLITLRCMPVYSSLMGIAHVLQSLTGRLCS